MNFVFDTSFPKLRGGFFEPGYVFMKDVPIRRISFTTPRYERAYLVKGITSHYKDYIASGNWEALLAFVQQQLARKPEASDIVHDLLAYLAEEMLRLNREKQAEQKAFLNELVEKLQIQQQPDKDGRIGIEALQGKARLINYLGDYQKGEKELSFADIGEIVLNNARRLGIAYYDRDRVMGELEARYEQSLALLKPIKAQLKATDELIDQVVYRLYGLTEEEIAIVEGESK
ncbi:MAG: hypothetical protein M3Z08_09365 [Chloroflexota bacterium]|nr:hypothetical protein [Chloroflexota bacterium]